jgi:ElaA protein
MQLNWTYKHFDELLPQELYAAMRLRNEVFVIEQNCIYLDADGLDTGAWHLLGWADGHLAAYCRILPPGLAFEQASIGRVVSSPRSRGTGAGRQLMEKAINLTLAQFGVTDIKIGAQEYLRNFYESLGFVQTGPGYLEDDIPHIPMVLKK